MKRKFIYSLVVMLFIVVSFGWGLLLTANQNAQVATSKDGLIRLHVLANSDSKEDQALKLQVRDAMIAYMEPLFKEAEDAAAAREIVAKERDNLIIVAREIITKNGLDYPVSIQMGTFDFPIKTYGDLVLPAGKYEAVRVLIGNGEGSNWWCVLFPPLCFIDITNGAAAPLKEKAEQPEIEYRSKLAELISGK